jgi:hypothetical protein
LVSSTLSNFCLGGVFIRPCGPAAAAFSPLLVFLSEWEENKSLPFNGLIGYSDPVSRVAQSLQRVGKGKTLRLMQVLLIFSRSRCTGTKSELLRALNGQPFPRTIREPNSLRAISFVNCQFESRHK